nr:phage tail protein [Kistimonas asteriae]
MLPQLAPVDLRFKEIQGLKVTRSLASDNNWGLLKPGVQRRTLTLKRGMPNDPTPLQVVQLIEQAYWDRRLLRTDMLIALLSDTPIPYPTKAWMVPRAFLETIEWDSLSADNNQVLIESMTYSYSQLIPLPI